MGVNSSVGSQVTQTNNQLQLHIAVKNQSLLEKCKEK